MTERPFARRTADWLLGLARQALPPARRAWHVAMRNELDRIANDGEALRWAVGCVAAGIKARYRDGLTNMRLGTGVAAWLDGFLVDLRHVVRGLVQARGFTAIAILTFALGMGLNIAVFSVFDRLLFRPLPYAEPDRLVQLHAVTFDYAFSTYEIGFAVQAEATTIAGLAWDDGSMTTAPAPGEAPLVLTSVTPNMLEVLGVATIRGRGFEPEDWTPGGGDTAVVLMHDTWLSRFGAAEDVLSHAWTADEFRYRVVGVLPPGFFLPSSNFIERRDGLFVRRQSPPRNGLLTTAQIARLQADVSLEAAQAELDAITARHGWDPDEYGRTRRPTIQPLRSGLSLVIGPYLWLTSSAVWLVLGVTCMNLSTLLLVRNRSRERLGAVRAALGASPRRLLRLALLDSTVLCLAGSAVGWLLCVWTSQAIVAVLPPSLRGLVVDPYDGRILAVSLTFACASAGLAGLLPALAARRVDVLAMLRSAASGPQRSGPPRAGRALLGVQAAFGVFVIVGAAATVPGFVRLLLLPPGYDARDLYTIAVGRSRDDQLSAPGPARLARIRSVLEVVSSAPNVAQAAVAFREPWNLPFQVPPEAETGFWDPHGGVGHDWALGSGVFQTIGTPVRAGREFSAGDINGDAPVAMLNETGARTLWPEVLAEAAVGRQISVAGRSRTVIGIAGDIREHPGEMAIPSLFLPLTISELRVQGTRLPIILRMRPGAVPDRELITRRLKERFGPNHIFVRSAAASVGETLDRPRFLATLFGTLAGIALLLAASGVYAVAAFELASRRHEMAIRLALGAPARRVRGALAGVILWPVLAGTAAGLIGVRLGLDVVQSRVTDVEPVGIPVLALAALLVTAATLASTWQPARKAAQLDPAAELRST